MRTGTVVTLMAAAGISFVGSAASQEDVVAKRLDLMKSLGPTLRGVYQMIQGEREFDAAVAEQAMLQVVEYGEILPTLFPEGSQEGTRASPLIWKEFDEFTAGYAALADAGRAGAEAAAANDPAGVGAAFDDIGNACGACHEKYRLPR
jgi:cytochrome c556